MAAIPIPTIESFGLERGPAPAAELKGPADYTTLTRGFKPADLWVDEDMLYEESEEFIIELNPPADDPSWNLNVGYSMHVIFQTMVVFSIFLESDEGERWTEMRASK